jgi:hypothetical protein
MFFGTATDKLGAEYIQKTVIKEVCSIHSPHAAFWQLRNYGGECIGYCSATFQNSASIDIMGLNQIPISKIKNLAILQISN